LWRPIAVYAGLVIAIAIVYAPVARFEFVNYDDPDYVTRNFHAQQGLTLESVQWAFTSTEAANWFPVTRLSYLLDVQLFGLDAGAFHLENVVIHALSSILLLALLHRTTRSWGPSVFVAAVWALHPMHVESVAWVAERKDVLSAFFFLAAMLLYVRGGMSWRVTVAFALGLMAKPMVVTLPAILLVMDYWPLRRSIRFVELMREKIPLFALSAASAVITFVVQQRAGAVRNVEVAPLGERVLNAFSSIVIYAFKTIWPGGLAVFYPFHVDATVALLCGVVVIAVCSAVYRWRSRFSFLAAGWCWYLIMLLPVIGLVQVGSQARADRYMYLPMIGLLVMIAWSTPGKAVAIAAVPACAACMIVSATQVTYWKNSETLFRRALEVTQDNFVAEHNLGSALVESGRFAEAIEPLNAALRLKPESFQTHSDMGMALANLNRLPEALAEFQAAVKLNPDSAILYNNLANALAQLGRPSEAIEEYGRALQLDPNYLEARKNLATVRSRPQSTSAESYYNGGVELERSGRLADAIQSFEAALKIKPDYAEAHSNLGVVLTRIPGRGREALPHLEAAARLDANNADAHVNYGIALANIAGDVPRAIAELEKAQKLHPDPETQKAIDQLRK
jgi:tetratricopeptide (TPR) repeat protein